MLGNVKVMMSGKWSGEDLVDLKGWLWVLEMERD